MKGISLLGNHRCDDVESGEVLARQLRAVCLSGLALLLLVSAASAAADREAFAAYEGEWQRVSRDEDSSRLDEIDRAIADLSWVMRKVAGPILRRRFVPPPGYVFQLDLDGLAMERSDREPRRLALDSVERHVETEFGAVTLSSLRIGDAIETRWKTEQAKGSNTFRLIDSGSTLLVEYTLEITAISGIDRIRYEARFARRPQ